MKIFTYEDYLKYSKILQQNNNNSTVITLREPSIKYELIPKQNDGKTIEIDNKYDKTFKTILENKEEAANFINKVLDFNEEIRPEDLEKYKTDFITRSFIAQESDIVYKLKNKKVFVLIEHQTKIDYSMAYRILNYQIEIIRNCVEEKKVKNKVYKHASVIAIVLYTGKSRWTASKDFKEIQENLYDYSMQILEKRGSALGVYNIVDINDYEVKELLESKSFLSKIMLLEKSENKEELLRNLNKIIPRTSEENKEILLRIINHTYKECFEEKTLREITKKIKEGGDENMLASVEMLKKENQKYLKKGATQNTFKLAKKMLKENLEIELIEKITGLKREKFM